MLHCKKAGLTKKGPPGQGLTALISASTVLGCMNILVPVDGSPASLRALDYAIKMASQTRGSSLVLLNVQNLGAMAIAGAAMAGDLQETASQASAEALGEAMEKSEAAGAVFKTVVRTGQVAADLPLL